MADIHVRVLATVNSVLLQHDNTEQIPPGYSEQDIRALAARMIEDTAFALNRREFGRAPTIQALIAAAARLKAIQAILDGPDGIVSRELRIRAVLALSNAEATEAYGENPEGE
jgi:hypothetical protein